MNFSHISEHTKSSGCYQGFCNIKAIDTYALHRLLLLCIKAFFLKSRVSIPYSVSVPPTYIIIATLVYTQFIVCITCAVRFSPEAGTDTLPLRVVRSSGATVAHTDIAG